MTISNVINSALAVDTTSLINIETGKVHSMRIQVTAYIT